MELELYSNGILPMLDGIEITSESTPTPTPPDEPTSDDKGDGVTILHMIPLIVAVIISITLMVTLIIRKRTTTKKHNENTEQK